MLLTSTGVISRSQQEESVLLLRKVEELNKNTARLIVEAGELIQESKQLSAQVKSLESKQCDSRRFDMIRVSQWSRCRNRNSRRLSSCFRSTSASRIPQQIKRKEARPQV